MAAKPPFTRFAESIAKREKGVREDIAPRLQMGDTDIATGQPLPQGADTPLQRIAEQTGGGPINPAELPMVSYLTNQYNVLKGQSQAREELASAQVKRLPEYMTAYRSYLKWRYPNRYGAGKSGTDDPYRTGGATPPSFAIPQLPAITQTPSFSKPATTAKPQTGGKPVRGRVSPIYGRIS